MSTATNPTLPYTRLTLNGEEYKLAVTHRGLALAEEELDRRGLNVTLLTEKARLIQGKLRAVSVLFAAALIPYQPDTNFLEAQELVTDDNLWDVLAALDAANAKCFPDPEEEESPADPPLPAPDPEES